MYMGYLHIQHHMYDILVLSAIRQYLLLGRRYFQNIFRQFESFSAILILTISLRGSTLDVRN